MNAITQTASQVEVKKVKVPGATLYVRALVPGSHGGWGSDPQEFAERLHDLFGARRESLRPVSYHRRRGV